MTIQTEINEPILFRTADRTVFESTLTTGSLWLRSGEYYRQLEDHIRNDLHEGSNNSRTTIPLAINSNGTPLYISGGGHIGQIIRPHYILSLHGTSISEEQRTSFGCHTFGVRAASKLAADLYARAAARIQCDGYRYGPVSYRYVNLTLSTNSNGSIITVGDNPPISLQVAESDILIKRPVQPFIEQDEWRIAIFTREYVNNDPNEPLRLQVSPSYFYPYLPSAMS